jgi:L-lactate dehydrogenase complex protein LldG
MNSREKILSTIRANQPELTALPSVPAFAPYFSNLLEKFTEVLTGIGASMPDVNDFDGVIDYIKKQFPGDVLFATTIPELAQFAALKTAYDSPHDLEHTELAIINAEFGVAENGAVWLTERELPERVLPFIPQHLAVVLRKEMLVATMHDAYRIIGDQQYGWGSFIAGPSKTADIEQSLVLGAHGPRTMTVFIL